MNAVKRISTRIVYSDVFTMVERLVADFQKDIERWRYENPDP